MAAWDGVQAWLWAGAARSSKVRGSPTNLEDQLPRSHWHLGPGRVCPSRGAQLKVGLMSQQGVCVASSQDSLRPEDG